MAHKITYVDEKIANIELVRGDSFIVDLGFDKGKSEYTPEAGDCLIFTMRKNFKDLPNDEILIQKEFALDETVEFELEPSDTKDLPYGSYKYDMEYDYADGRVDTPLSGSFKLAKEVT